MDLVRFLCITSCIVIVRGNLREEKFNRILTDRLIRGSDNKHDDIRSIIECATICEKTCYFGYAYSSQTRECFLYNQISGGAPLFPGMVTFSRKGNLCRDSSYTLFQKLCLCLKVYDINRETWPKAKEICESDGGRLLVVQQYAETMTVLENLSLTRQYNWIGAGPVSGTLTWLDGSHVEPSWWTYYDSCGTACCLAYDRLANHLFAGTCSAYSTHFICEMEII